MAYAAVISLKNTIQGIQHSGNFSIPNSESIILDSTIEEIESLQRVLEILDDRNGYGWRSVKVWDLVESQMLKRFPYQYPIVQLWAKDIEPLDWFCQCTRVNGSDGRIRRAVSKLVEVLHQWFVSSKKLLVESDREKQEIYSFTQTVKMINEETKVKEEDYQNKSKDIVDLNYVFPKSRDLIYEIREFAKKVLINLKTTVQRFDKGRSNNSRERMDALDVRIREAVCELEDLLETRVSGQFLNSQSESLIRILPFPLNLHEVERYILPFTQLVKKLKQEYMDELMVPLFQENENDDDFIMSMKSFSCKNKCEMVGLHDVVVKLKDELTDSISNLEICRLYGMAGIGKTMVASKVFEDPSMLDWFELHVWVDVGQNYQFKRIMQSIIAQVSPDNIDELLTTGDESLEGYLHKSLSRRRYLIVLDDVWDGLALDDVTRFFPDNKNGSRVLLTTRLDKVAPNLNRIKMRFLNNEESWDLLREKVFGKEPCPSLLKNFGKKIAESCEGLPLTIVTVGELLSKVEKEPKKWNKLAANPNPLLEEAYEQMLKVLLPSYNGLPNRELKACFLYMGVFPRNYEISRSEITKLWAADIIFDRDSVPLFMIIDELVENSIIIPGQKSSSFGLKNWRLHSVFWHLCKKVAWKIEFFHAIKCSSSNSSLEGLKSLRRLCIHNNVLLGNKDVHNSIASISTARAILCTGPPHQYPVPICFGLKLLKILNALTIRLYEFPEEVLKLSHLKYLALTCYQDLPSSISKLRNLQFLIVRRHLSIISSEVRSFLPVEIWDIKELKHLQVMGSDLPDPCHDDNSLPNLETLLDVSAHSCTKCVFKGIPNLKKLGIRIELAPHSAEVPSRCFNHISHLKKLESLKCVVVNPSFSSEVDFAPPPPLLNFPSSLEKLSLSGFGYLWEDMRPIASLPNLTTLKLRSYAFCGPKWEIQDNGFPKLRFLLIEDTDLSNWIVGRGSLMNLSYLFLKSCYKLEMIPDASFLPHIELENCNPLGVACAQQVERFSMGDYHLAIISKSMLD